MDIEEFFDNQLLKNKEHLLSNIPETNTIDIPDIQIQTIEKKPKPKEKKYTLTADVINSINESKKKDELLNWFRLATDTERIEVFKTKNNLFTLSKKDIPFDEDTKEELYKVKDSDLAGFSYLMFVISCYLVKERPIRKGRTNELLDKIREEKERRQIQKMKGQKFIDKLRKHYDKITDLRNQGMSWRLLAQYLKKHYAKYYQDYELNYSYLRRAYMELQKRKTLQKGGK